MTASAGSAGAGTAPACVKPAVDEGTMRATDPKTHGECDFEEQSIDFDVAANYPIGTKTGYDPAATPVAFTDFGTAFSGSQTQICHAYCYKGSLTIGLDLLPGSDASTRGEALFGFPTPIANADGRDTLGWIYVDSATPLPVGAMLKGQLVLKSSSKGILVAKDTVNVPFAKWQEFKYFHVNGGFNTADLVDITSIGFRLSVTPNTAVTAAWHGVVYADHFQLRK